MKRTSAIPIGKNESPLFFYDAHSFYEKYIGLINSAKVSIHLQTYIFENDQVGKRVVSALKAAVKRGVQVYVLLDRLGSSSLSKEFVNDLKAANINLNFFGAFRWFKFLSKKYFIGRRLHHKLLLVDFEKSLVGGINIGEDFLTWFDFGVLIQGESCYEIYRACLRCLPFYLRQGLKNECPTKISRSNSLLRILINDGLYYKKNIHDRLNFYLKNAKSEIFIISAYFFPNQRLIRKLKRLTKRGVKIKVLCNHLSDVPFINNATRFHYLGLLKSGVEIYEWTPSVLHGKAIIVDHSFLNLGSYNINYMGQFTNVELNVEVLNKEDIWHFYGSLEGLLSGNTKQFSIEDFKGNVFQTILFFISYLIVRLVSIVSVIFVHDSKKLSLDDF